MNALRLAMLFWLALSVPAVARTWTVNPGQSIQEAIDKAEPGDTVQAIPGEYGESLRIEKENLRVVGMTYEGQRTELLGENELEVGITIAANGVTVEGFVLRDFTSIGVQAKDASGITVRGLNVIKCGNTGIDFEQIVGGAIENCVSGNARLFNVRVYRSQEIRVADGEYFQSGTGIYFYEVIQSSIENNAVYSNFTGISINGHGDPEHPADFCKVMFNRVVRNDRDRQWAGSMEATFAVYGFGIQIHKADHTEVARNIIEGNAWIGVSVTGSPTDKENAQQESPHTSDHTYAHHNTYANNGFGKSMSKSAKEETPQCDIYWDGTGERNQFQESQDVKTVPEKLVVEQGGVHTEVIHFL